MKNFLANILIPSVKEYICNEIISNIPSHTFRIFLYKTIGGLKIGNDSSISMHCQLLSPWKIKIGDNVSINQFVYLDGRGTLTIHNNVNIGRATYIHTGSHEYNDTNFGYYEKKVIIHCDSWIASNVIILPGVVVNNGAVVGAGSIVTKDLEEYSMNVGNPAAKVKSRIRNLEYKTKYFKPLY